MVAGEFRLAPSADLDFRPTLTYCFRKYPSTCELNYPQRVVNSTCLKIPPNPLKPFASESTPKPTVFTALISPRQRRPQNLLNPQLFEPLDPSESNVKPTAELKDVVLPIAIESTRTLALQMQAFDGMLWEIDKLLNDLQPRLTGKIRFWQPKDDLFQRFIPIIWRRSKKDNKWKFDKFGWSYLTLRVMRARSFNDNCELVRELLELGMELAKARANLLLCLTSYSQGSAKRLKHAIPRGTQMRAQINNWKTSRDAGQYRTFITGHQPVRKD